MTESPLTTSNRETSGRVRPIPSLALRVSALLTAGGAWLALNGGCGSRSAVTSESAPPAISASFERLPSLLAEIKGSDVTLHEGLPDNFWEPELRGKELQRTKTIRIRSYPFYEEKLPLKEADSRQLTATLSAPGSFAPYSGAKSSGEYNPDYCRTWKASGGETLAMISLECAEAKLYGPNLELHCDLSSPAAEQLKQLFQAYRKYRPPQ